MPTLSIVNEPAVVEAPLAFVDCDKVYVTAPLHSYVTVSEFESEGKSEPWNASYNARGYYYREGDTQDLDHVLNILTQTSFNIDFKRRLADLRLLRKNSGVSDTLCCDAYIGLKLETTAVWTDHEITLPAIFIEDSQVLIHIDLLRELDDVVKGHSFCGEVIDLGWGHSSSKITQYKYVNLSTSSVASFDYFRDELVVLSKKLSHPDLLFQTATGELTIGRLSKV